jgi:hypothetical protein
MDGKPSVLLKKKATGRPNPTMDKGSQSLSSRRNWELTGHWAFFRQLEGTF